MKFSIITPSFNQGRYIEETIRSVVTQDAHIEYLVIDGKSVDDTVEILSDYKCRYPDIIHWVSEKDNGQVDAINKGMKKATGDILAFINSDDYYLPDAFRCVEQYFLANPEKKWLVGNCRVSDAKLAWTFSLKHMLPIEKIPWLIKIFNVINQPAVFIKRELFEGVGFFDEQYSYAFDYDYWLRCLHVGGASLRVRTVLSVFRIQNESKSNINFKAQFDEDYEIAKKYIDNKFFLSFHFLVKILVVCFYRVLKK